MTTTNYSKGFNDLKIKQILYHLESETLRVRPLVNGDLSSQETPFSPGGNNDSWFSLTNLVIGGVAGIGAVVAAPVVLGAAEFGAAGVAAGSLAAAVQGSAVVSGSAFALAQSAGAAGLGVGAKAALFMGGAAAGSVASKKNDL
ncbi:interferon alpha-inducible protein 27-like protein 2 [Mya arenaria]|uniref:interferon alpha-inducible protein 27-like protein 2 n=1 Tax=Mya arenaria TaxID=6604 RepID=UPI0022E2587A|nr:interferon alpha-inducible protein 27-like protein 2 [Mya arenaria]